MSRAEDLVNWYLRLNGLLTIPNFILHPDRSGSQRTDADVIGIRFPFRREFENSDCDDPRLEYSLIKPSLFIVEVKTKEIDFNEAWQNPNKANINKVLTDFGLFESDKQVVLAADALYETGRYQGEQYYCSLLFIGNVDVDKIPERYSSVPKILWKDIIEFIHVRFRRFVRIKANHDQWDEFGKKLYDFAVAHHSLSEFEAKIREYCFLPAA